MPYRPSRRAVITALVILVVVGASLAILPEVARRVALHRLQAVFTVPVSIADVDVNLFTGHAAVENLVIGNEGSRPILSLPALSIDFSQWSLLAGRINLQSVVAQSPRFLLERLGANTFNIIEAVRWPGKSEDASSDGVSLAIERLEIDGGEIVFVDQTQEPDYEVTFSSVDLAAGPIATLPDTEVTPTDFTAGVQVGKGTIKFTGSTTPFGEALQTQVTADIADVRLKTFNVYLPYGARLNLEKSVLSGQTQYVFASREGKPAKHSLDATLKIGNIGLLSAETAQPILELAGVTARDIHLNFMQNNAQIGALAFDKPYVLLKRDSSGFNVQQFALEARTPIGEVEQNEQNDLQLPLVIHHVEAAGGTIEFVDETVTPAVQAVFRSVSLAAEDLTVLPSFAAATITGEAQAGKGSLQLTGSAGKEPLEGRLSLVADGVPFAPYRGYLDQLFSSANSNGDYLNGKLQLLFSPGESGELATSVSGHLEGYAMSLGFPDKEKPFLAAERLDVDLRTIRLGSNPRVDIDRIAFFGADLTVLRSKDGTLNVSRLWRSDEEESTRAPQQENNPATTVAIRAITVEKSMIEIFDTSVSPNYTTTVTALKGKLWNLVPSAKRAPVELQGILGKSSELRLSGWFTPFTEKPAMHLEGTIRSYALPPLNPYATQYISHRIRQGQITTEVNYTLNGDELEASADIVLRDVRVGEKTGDEFENRIGIPLELAIALLQDINGVIRLQLGMSAGTGLQLDIGSLIWNAVQNAIVRAITAPFRLIGRILTFGGRIGEITIEPLLFQPGTRELQNEGVKQLADIAELLKQKPRLELALNGKTSQEDIEALKKNEFWKRLAATGERAYDRALIRVYREMGGITRPVTPLKPIAEESLERFVMERIPISDEQLRQLAVERAETVKAELQERAVDPERLLARAGQDFAKGENPAVDVELIS